MNNIQEKVESLLKSIELIMPKLEAYIEAHDEVDANRLAQLTTQTLELCKNYLRGNKHDVQIITQIEELITDMIKNPSRLPKDEVVVSALLRELEREVAVFPK